MQETDQSGQVSGMRLHRIARRTAIVAAAALAVPAGLMGPASAGAASGSTAGGTACPWVSSHASPQARAAMLAMHMTLDQKVTMMYPSGGVFGSGIGGYQQVTDPIPALCLPSLVIQDGPFGVIGTPAGTATQLPAPIDVAASFSTAVARSFGTVQGDEAQAKGIDGIQGPDVNIARVPQNGRDGEAFGEDPYLSGQLAVANIDGLQSTGTFSVLKHFAAYNQETYRNTPADDDIVSERTLREIYLPAFEAAVTQAKPGGVMCSYAQINGTSACQNAFLMTDVLENQWGFQGFIRSDANAVHDITASVNAGLDFWNSGIAANATNATDIEQAVAASQIAQSQVNNAVERILTTMFRFGIFNRTLTGTIGTDASTPQDVATALTSAEQGTVLLQNAGNILPLNPATEGSIAVIGSDGGSGAETTSTSDRIVPSSIVTPYQGIQAAAGSGTTVTYNDGSDLTQAAAAAAAAKVAVVFVNDPAGEGKDLTTLALPNGQDQLIEAVAQANPNTVVVVNSGNPVLMPWLHQVKGVIEAWYPGQQDGTAIAAVLFGKVNPSGKLPMTFPASDTASPVGTAAQWPGVNGQVEYSEGLDVGYRGYDELGIQPLFPFGYGLSYTQFTFSGLQLRMLSTRDVNPNRAPDRVVADVLARVTNTGSRAGTEVAQLYLGDPASAQEPPRQLKGFDRVTLAPHQSKTVTIPLTARDLAYWNSAHNGWAVAPGAYRVWVGDSSALAGLPLTGGFSIP